MNSNGQWPGQGQPESTEIFRELVDAMPQLPIGKLMTYTKGKLVQLKEIATPSDTIDSCVSNPIRSSRAVEHAGRTVHK